LARAAGRASNQDSTCAALPFSAAILAAGEVELFAQDGEQTGGRIGVNRATRSIHVQLGDSRHAIPSRLKSTAKSGLHRIFYYPFYHKSPGGAAGDLRVAEDSEMEYIPRWIQSQKQEENMRKLLICMCAVLLIAAAASAQGKVDSQLKCGKPSPQNSIDVGDKPNHAYSIAHFSCTYTKGEFDGVKNKDGAGTQFDEVTSDASRYHGYYMENEANGDAIHYSYEGKATLKGGKFVSGDHKWTAIRGTGKFAGIKASGTCKGTGNPDGGVAWTCDGTYTLKAAPAKAAAPKKKM
jgi:hypothetical protein